MSKLRMSHVGLVLLGAVACASTNSQLAQGQPVAVDTALNRGRFDLNCQTAAATVLSSDYIQPAVSGRWGVGGVTRLEYTIGVEGCEKQEVYVVICQEGTNTCFATPSHGNAPTPTPQ